MLLQFALVLAMLLQIFAAGISIKLTRVTKYNVSWILISAGFIIMAVRRFFEFLPMISDYQPKIYEDLFVWLGVAISFFFAAGVFWIQKIFKYMKKVEEDKREMEKAFLNAIIQAEETERKRFAKDLHDGLGPILSTVKMSVSSVSRMEENESVKKILRNTDTAIDEAIKSIREISNNLSPHILNNFGLNKAMRNFINKINLSDAVKIDFQSNFSNQRFDNNIEVVLYRVLCELINNTIKHAKASSIEIVLKRTNNRIECQYRDNGLGFNPEKLSIAHLSGMGYSNMVSRINSLNGNFDISSEMGNGTTATFSIPINSNKFKNEDITG
jgi:signal transduction histidine kinase